MTISLRARLHGTGARQLGPSSADRVEAVLGADPVGTVMVAGKFESARMDRDRLGGTFWGSGHADPALCFVGANLMPLAGDRQALWAIADALRARGRRCASIVGRAEFVAPLWERVRPWWGPARHIRPDQPLLTCADVPAVAPDERVVTVDAERIGDYFPAAVAMFTEEVGVDPTAGDGGLGYRARVTELLSARRAFAIFDGPTVVYKAEVGALSRRVGLIQGVWVHPDHRGQGIAAPATAAVVRAVQRWGRLPSLYVNSFNAPARQTYARVGFEQVGTFSSVLF